MSRAATAGDLDPASDPTHRSREAALGAEGATRNLSLEMQHGRLAGMHEQLTELHGHLARMHEQLYGVEPGLSGGIQPLATLDLHNTGTPVQVSAGFFARELLNSSLNARHGGDARTAVQLSWQLLPPHCAFSQVDRMHGQVSGLRLHLTCTNVRAMTRETQIACLHTLSSGRRDRSGNMFPV